MKRGKKLSDSAQQTHRTTITYCDIKRGSNPHSVIVVGFLFALCSPVQQRLGVVLSWSKFVV